MRFLVTEKLGPHKFKTPEGYLICTDAILSRTGKQEYKRCELFGDACEDPDKIVNVERTDDEVFSDKAMASFENKAVCIEHPDHDVNAENHNELAVGFVRDIHKGEDNGKPVMMGTLVITDKDAVEAVESGEYKELSCGYDCDIADEDGPQQRNIRGNHVALCKQGRAGIARIVDSVNDMAKLSAEESATLKAMIEGGAGKSLYNRLSFDKPVNIHLSQEEKELLRWHRDENQYLTNEEKILLKKLVGDYKVKDSEYHQIDMTDPWGGTRSLIVKAFSFEEAKKKAEKFKPEWKFRAGYRASEADVDYAKRRGLYVDSVNDAEEDDIKYGYKDRMAGVYDKWYRYNRKDCGRNYDLGQRLAAKEKNAPENVHFIEIMHDTIKGFYTERKGIIYVFIDYKFVGKFANKQKAREAGYDIDGYIRFNANYESEEMKKDMQDIQATKKPGTDKIIYVMQSDIDKNLYFYIGKTFSMKEGNWGYTKFEMGNTTPDELKSELARNGWHQVVNGPARIIDASNEEWTVVEEENYKKANKPIIDEEYVQLPRGRFKVVEKTKEEVEREGYGYHHSANGYSVYTKNNAAIAIKDTMKNNKEQLFTIEYEQDGVMHICKVRANSIEDAISKVKDDSHKVVIFTKQVLSEMGKNNSIGKYDRVIQAMRSLYSESLLPDDKLKELIRKKVPEYIKKYVKE